MVDQLAKMPDQLSLDGVKAVMAGSNIWIDKVVKNPMSLLSVDDLLFDRYLRKAVAYTLYGDMLHGHTHSPVNLLGDHIHTSQILDPQGYNNGYMKHIDGFHNNKKQSVWISYDKVIGPYGGNETGGRLLIDLLSLFYEPQALNDENYNIKETWRTEEVDGLASYRFDDLAARTETRWMAANYDMEKIAGVVRIAGAGGEDTVTINAQSDVALTVDVGVQSLHMGEFRFTGDPMLAADVVNAQSFVDAYTGDQNSPDYLAQKQIISDARDNQKDWLRAEHSITPDGISVSNQQGSGCSGQSP